MRIGQPEISSNGPSAGITVCRKPITARWFPRTVSALLSDGDGSILAGTHAGLAVFSEGNGQPKPRFGSYTHANGLPLDDIHSLGRDRDGNVWIGTDSGGAGRLAANGFRTYGFEDG